jgi:hypothetical protein
MTIPFPFGANVPTVALELLVQLRISGQALGGRLLACGALWPRHLLPALEHAKVDAADFASISVRITAVYPHSGEHDVPPDFSQSDYEPDFRTDVAAAFDGSPWQELISDVEVREEWHPDTELRIDAAIYGKRRAEPGP